MPLSIAFFLSLLTTITSTAIFPSVKLFAFAPFVTLAFTRKNLVTALWLSIACGCIVDMMQTQYHFGLYALCYCITTTLLYRQKWLIFADKPFSLSLFVALYSLIATLIHLVLLTLFGTPSPHSILWLAADLFLMLFVDATYAMVVFTLPYLAYEALRKKILLMKAAREETT